VLVELRNELQEPLDACSDECGGLLPAAALGRVEPADGRLVGGVRGEPVDGVGGKDCELSRLQRLDRAADHGVDHARPSTTRSRPVRSSVLAASE
jgi:hypothetical protein